MENQKLNEEIKKEIRLSKTLDPYKEQWVAISKERTVLIGRNSLADLAKFLEDHNLVDEVDRVQYVSKYPVAFFALGI